MSPAILNVLSEITGYAYKKQRFDKAILAVGSTEYHGDHLPFGTDTIISQQLAEKVAERIPDMLILPQISYGMSEHYSSFPLTISLTSKTLTATLKDIFASILKHNIQKLVIINGHDGNIASIENATREFRTKNAELKICVLEAWWTLAAELVPKGTLEVWEGLGHGGECETSVMLAVRPKLVQMKYARGVVPNLPLHMTIKWTFDELTPYGVTGDPTKATKEKGEKLWNSFVDTVVSSIKEMDRNNWKYEFKKTN